MPIEQDDKWVELISEESDSNLDPKDHEMIDSWTTYFEVRV